MAYEAMNNAGAMGSRLIVVLNDNDMSIAPPTGAMSAYLARIVTSQTYRSLRDVAKQLAARLPKFLYDKVERTEEYGRGFSPAARCSRNSVSTTSARSTATTSTTCCRSSRTSATCPAGRCWSTS